MDATLSAVPAAPDAPIEDASPERIRACVAQIRRVVPEGSSRKIKSPTAGTITITVRTSDVTVIIIRPDGLLQESYAINRDGVIIDRGGKPTRALPPGPAKAVVLRAGNSHLTEADLAEIEAGLAGPA